MKILKFIGSSLVITAVIMFILSLANPESKQNRQQAVEGQAASSSDLPPDESNESQEEAVSAAQDAPAPTKSAADYAKPTPSKINSLDLGHRVLLLEVFETLPTSTERNCPQDSVFATLHNAQLDFAGELISLGGCYFQHEGKQVFRSLTYVSAEQIDLTIEGEHPSYDSFEQAASEVNSQNLSKIEKFTPIFEAAEKYDRTRCEGYRAANNPGLADACQNAINIGVNTVLSLKKWGFVDPNSYTLCGGGHSRTDSYPACFVAAFDICRPNPFEQSSLLKCGTVFSTGQWVANPKARRYL